MSAGIPTVVIRDRKIIGNKTAYDLMKEGFEEILVCDMDSIITGRTNMKVYNDLAKFFEFIAFNLVYNIGELVDSIVSGASKVVISPDLSGDTLLSMLEFSQNIVIPNSEMFQYFQQNGGKYAMTYGTEPRVEFSMVYNIGPWISKENYTNIDNFPPELRHFVR